jgi:hypothetical protein
MKKSIVEGQRRLALLWGSGSFLALVGVACRSPQGLRLPRDGSVQIPCLEDYSLRLSSKLTQVVASIAKSGPEHLCRYLFFRSATLPCGSWQVIKSCFEFLLQEIAPYSKRNFVFFRIVWHKSARMHVGFGEKYLIPTLESVQLSIPCF